jgi:hypothetical protein
LVCPYRGTSAASIAYGPRGAPVDAFIFRGRVGGKSLKPGYYRLNGKATDNARNTSAVKRASFTVVG